MKLVSVQKNVDRSAFPPQPSLPVSQKVHARAQPTWLEMQTVVRVGPGKITVSMTSPSSVESNSRSDPSSAGARSTRVSEISGVSASKLSCAQAPTPSAESAAASQAGDSEPAA